MRKLMKKLPAKAAVALLTASGLLLLSGSVGGARAALTYYSDVYSSRVELGNIGVTLLEHGETDDTAVNGDGIEEESYRVISRRDYDKDGNWTEDKGELLTTMLSKDESGNQTEDLKIGKKYTEKLKVQNTGAIGEYVRVSIYKYWMDENNDPDTDVRNRKLDPEVIQLQFANTDDWKEDTAAGTEERTVLYYNKMLPSGAETSPFTEAVWIDQSIVNMVMTEETAVQSPDGTEGYTTIKSTYVYDGKQFCIEVEVDAVQDHNAKEAILSAWGKDVDIDGSGNIVKLNN